MVISQSEHLVQPPNNDSCGLIITYPLLPPPVPPPYPRVPPPPPPRPSPCCGRWPDNPHPTVWVSAAPGDDKDAPCPSTRRVRVNKPDGMMGAEGQRGAPVFKVMADTLRPHPSLQHCDGGVRFALQIYAVGRGLFFFFGLFLWARRRLGEQIKGLKRLVKTRHNEILQRGPHSGGNSRWHSNGGHHRRLYSSWMSATVIKRHLARVKKRRNAGFVFHAHLS